MTVHIHPSVDNGVKKGSGSFAGGTLVCKCADKQVKVGIKGDVAHNHACGCTKCWKPDGATFSVVAVVPRENVTELENGDKLHIIDGICNSACTMVFGIVPMNKICVTPRASLGFHQAYYDKAFTLGIKVTSSEGTSDLMSYYPNTVKDWIRRNGGLTTEMKKIKNGSELWKIVDPCPEEW